MVKIKCITKNNLFKTGFTNSFFFSSSFFFQEGREKKERITSCRIFSVPIDFYRKNIEDLYDFEYL
jgi:hypothetical protein